MENVDLLDIICVDNSIGDNKSLFTIGEIYKGRLRIDGNGNINYEIMEQFNHKGIFRYKKTVTGIQKDHIYFEHVAHKRNRTIIDILK